MLPWFNEVIGKLISDRPALSLTGGDWIVKGDKREGKRGRGPLFLRHPARHCATTFSALHKVVYDLFRAAVFGPAFTPGLDGSKTVSFPVV
jgi:hypothetical protein